MSEPAAAPGVAMAPCFTRPVYVAYVGGEDDERFKTAIQGLRLVAAQEEADEKTVNRGRPPRRADGRERIIRYAN